MPLRNVNCAYSIGTIDETCNNLLVEYVWSYVVESHAVETKPSRNPLAATRSFSNGEPVFIQQLSPAPPPPPSTG